MKHTLKYISLILAVIFIICGTMLSASADEEIIDQTPVDQTPVDQTPVDQTPVDQTPVDQTPVDQTPVDQTPVDQTPVDQQVDPNAGVSNIDSGEDYGNDYNYYQTYEDDQLWYGDASNYDYNSISDSTTGSISSQTTLYNTSGISEDDVKPNEWSDITLDEKAVTTGVADFSSIKTNTEKQDNGDWILYLGYVLLALSVLGILYFVISTLAQRRADKAAAARERRRSSAPARSTAARMEERERRASNTSAPRTSRYADEYSGRARRVSSKADTGEIYVPRRTRNAR